MADLVCYRVRKTFDGQQITDSGQVVKDDEGNFDVYGPENYGAFSAALYVRNTALHPLPWQAFVREGFGAAVELPLVRGSAAVVVVSIGDPPQFYALPFGIAGRYLLRDGVYERNFGLKVALNLVYSGDATAEDTRASRIQSVDTTRLGTTTMRARKQASRLSTLETFDVDRMREMLRSLVVRPDDADAWGARVVGGDPAKIAKDLDFADLGEFCRAVGDVADRKDYRNRVPWVDDVRLVQDAEERTTVQDAVIAELREGDPDERFAVSPPEIMEWLGLAGFQLTKDRRGRRESRVRRPDVELQHVLTSEFRQEVDFGVIRRHQLYALDGNGGDLAHWSLWRCLAGSLDVNGRTYVLDDGEIFEVEPDYMHEVDRVVDSVAEAAVALPDCPAGLREGEYNQLAAGVDGLLLLDCKLVAPGYSTRIEVLRPSLGSTPSHPCEA